MSALLRLPSRHTVTLLAVLAAFAGARALYYTYAELEYDGETLRDYFQFVDPVLLRSDLVESVLHLHSQPPLFNLYLGIVLKALPTHYELAFNVVSVAAGVVLVLSTLQLQLRLGVGLRVAGVVTTLFAVSPVTVLYENWLYPTYFVAAFLALATLFLHRYAAQARLRDGACFFALLGVVVLTRGTYQAVWFVLPVVVLAIAMPMARRTTAIAVVVPLAAVLGMSVLTYAQFETPLTGGIYGDINLAQMTTLQLPPATLDSLIRKGKISPINRLSIYDAKPADYLPYVPPPRSTGVAVLDEPVKSTGAANWHSLWFMRIADRYGTDARFVLRRYPGVYLRSVADNVGRYFGTADQAYPFREMGRDDPMRRALRVWDLVVAGQFGDNGIAILNLVALPAAIGFGLLFLRRALACRPLDALHRPTKADALTVLFIVYNVLYIAAVGILFSSGDQNRYRIEAMPLVCVLLALLLSASTRGRAHRERRIRPG